MGDFTKIENVLEIYPMIVICIFNVFLDITVYPSGCVAVNFRSAKGAVT